MQRDFLEPGGFGESLGNDVSQLRRTIEPLAALLAACRAAGLPVIHTREGHLPDLSDCPPAKLTRGAPSKRIGDPGPIGRILIRGEYGHDIVDELRPGRRRAGRSTSPARAPSTPPTSASCSTERGHHAACSSPA